MTDVRMCGFERRTPVEDGVALIDSRATPLPAESIALAGAAGRVAAEDVVAAIDVPHFRRAMMDGFAVVAASTFEATDYQPRSLSLVGEVRAGHPSDVEVGVGLAVAVTTGAPLPKGADAVVMVENCRVVPGESEGTRVEVRAPVSPGKHVGSVGEDIACGSTILRAGRVLRPQDLGVVASVGRGEVSVVRRPRVRLLMTGDELVKPGHEPDAGRIVDSNSVVLRALVERDHGIVSGVDYVPDDRDAVRAALRHEDDVLLVSGGSSVGPEDHAPIVLAELGEVLVHGVAMRPASPAGFGIMPGPERFVFLLPGNPVSCLCAYEFFAGRFIRILGGRPATWPHRVHRTVAAAKFVSPLGRTDYTRVTLDERGATPLMTSGASLLSSTTRADGVVIVPDALEGYPAGSPIDVLLYD